MITADCPDNRRSGRKSVDTPRGYVRRADLLKDHAGAAFL